MSDALGSDLSPDPWGETVEHLTERAKVCIESGDPLFVVDARFVLSLVAIAKAHGEAAERAERAEQERDAGDVRLCEERDRVAAMEAALYAAPSPEAVRNWHTGGYLAWYERTRRAALAAPDQKEGIDGR